MKFINYQDIHELKIPDSVSASLNDNAELAHIKQIEKGFYIIIRYPHDNQLQTVCIEIEDEEVFVYMKQDLSFSVNEQMSVSQFFLLVLREYELQLMKVDDILLAYEHEFDLEMDKEKIKNLFRLNRSLILYQNALSSISQMIQHIRDRHMNILSMFWEDIESIDIDIEISQLKNNTIVYQKIIGSILDISNSLYSNKLNKVMKSLTSITLVISISTFMTSFYGMNINLPFQDHPNALWFVMITSLIITILVSIVMYRKDYF